MLWLIMRILFFYILFINTEVFCYQAVLLKDVQVLTLYQGSYTTGRRSSAVLQLQCMGGSAGCHKFVPQVVQCTNKGWDGIDVQWDCKTEMDNKYKFGRITVSCEGYNSPDDPYILAGSCGLEYYLELTGSGSYEGSNTKYYSDKHTKDSTGSSFFLLIGFAAILYAIYWFSTRNNANPYNAPGGGGGGGGMPPPPPYDDPHVGPPRSGPPPGTDDYNPPPYGFKSQFSSATNQQQQGFTSSSGTNQAGTGGVGGPNLGGFWTGAGLGGLAGYLFGSRGNNNRGGYYPGGTGYDNYGGGGSSWFSNPFSGGSTTTNRRPFTSSSNIFTTNSGSSSSGTRTASGFGGTSRR